MKSALLSALIIGMAASTANADVVNPDSTGFKFTDVKVVKTTPVRDQNKTGTCWCFSANTFLESEILRKTGKEVDLSEMFVVRHCYLDKAKKYMRLYGQCNFEQGGGTVDNTYVWRNYGMVPEEVYSGLNYGEKKHIHSEMFNAMQAYMKEVAKNPNKKVSTAWYKGLEGILDAYLGPEPKEFTYKGKTYTPQTYAASLGLNMDDYVAFTSFNHHPFYTQFPLEVADNWLWANFYNVPLKELKEIVDNAIDKGYAVVWAADVSEGGFKWYKGYALMPKDKNEKDMEGTELSRWVKLSDKDREAEKFNITGPIEEMKITQEIRQEMFDSQETTDDHGMVIVGKAVDQEGNKYYKVQNSWDTNQIYDGFFYVSEAYFLAKTMDILVNKEVIPSKIANKINL